MATNEARKPRSAKLMAATMDHFREHWEALKYGRPGRRFQNRYDQTRRDERVGGFGVRLITIAAAIVCLAIALVLSVIPGPAFPFYFIAGGLLASESRTVARLMDWIEVHVRRALAWGKLRWRRLSKPARFGVLAIAATASASATYAAYRVFIG